ncbi:hypothetical protein DL98DRAFT_524466 [Cadophora sp. DSE1049]|nr:hypothetical protein DL98DRAFT_524466 [Cadophora sp. DSE1049]
MTVAMSSTISFQGALFPLVHSIDCNFLVVFSTYLGVLLAAMLYKKALGMKNSVDTHTGMTLQYLELSERSCDSYIDLHKRYQKLMSRNYERHMDLQTEYFRLAQNNEELIGKYGEVVEANKELAGAHSGISEINERMVRTYEKFSKEYGFMAMSLGYALGGYAQMSAR